MYFKSLELFGFKSFADKTKVNFEQGITAIVGPNGCGKSNIADAVKWVLGEQSAKALRGSSMGDVIFNGTELREPLGYAEVSLTLSNESKFLPIEYDEVAISRRLYRSGESEYLINKNPVRLKDVDELLMGSGMGTNAYSMIEQGMIGQVLSSNPNDRRAVFEEASGITKYKSQKREAIRKLEHTEQNLLRINDIIKEVERQINSIERQARKAKRHQELFNRLKDLDTRLTGFQYKQMKDKKETLGNKKGIDTDREKELFSCINQSTRSLEEEREKLDKLNSRITQYDNDKRDALATLQRSQDKIGLNRERLQELYKYETEQKNEIDSLSGRIVDVSRTMEEITSRLTFISENTKTKENRLAAKEKEFSDLKKEIVKNNDIIKGNKLKTVDIFAAQSKFRNEITKIASDIQNMAARLRRLNLEKDNVAKELTVLQDNLSETRLSVNMSISKVGALESERITLQNNLKKERDSFISLENNIEESKNSVLSLNSKLNFLKDLVKRHEGFTGGTQALLNKLYAGELKLDGTCEPLAELLEPQRGYEAACEAALMPYLQTVVVESWDTAFKAIEFLEDSNLGKATFIKSDPTSLDLESLSLDNELVISNILNFMRFDFKYRALFTKILRNTLLVNTIEDGIAALKTVPQDLRERVRFVSLKGDMIAADMVTGGGTAQDSITSIVGRQMRIREIEGQIAESEKEILKLKQELNVKKEIIEDYQSKIKKVEDSLHAQEINLAQRRSAEANLEKEHKKIKEEFDLVDLEIEESMMTSSELKEREAALKEKLTEAENEEANLQKIISDSQKFIDEGAVRKESLLIEITQAQTELSLLRKDEDEFYKRAQTQKDYYDEQLKLIDSKKESLQESSRRQEELKKEIEKLEADIDCLSKRDDVIEKELGILQEESLQLKDIINEKQKCLSKIKEELDTAKDSAHNLEMEVAQLAFQMETLRNKIGQVYKVDLEEILSGLEPIEDKKTVEDEVKNLSQSVEKMGPVNLVAIDEHKELEERFTFLKRQQEDLANAKESLLKAIKKINQTTRELFMDTFNSIQNEFKNYFRFLFGGGKAEIVLLDDKDVLESGIEIIARPPGKKLQTISLLSGGEKALTAIALLFAIFKVKPSPFCILDEIDAPLDESNIGRFSKVLQEFSRTSQFIIITHNKKTINISDVMYGITMEQSGISKIISVKFAKRLQKEEAVAA